MFLSNVARVEVWPLIIHFRFLLYTMLFCTILGLNEGLRVILPLLLWFNKKFCPQCSVKTCSQGQLGHGPIYLCIVTAVRGREEIDREIKMTTSGVKPKMGIGRFYISVTMGNVKKKFFSSWSDVLCDGNSNRIWNLHHGKFHVGEMV